MGEAVVQLSNIWKRFRLGETHDSLRDLLTLGLQRLLGRRHSQPDEASWFWALSDVNLLVRRGEAVGIIGPNGAGKSTILKLLAGILRPDRGQVVIDGRLAALIEVGAGFHGDLTGRENIFLNGAILGMSRAEIRRKLDAIVQFAGIERFIDMPVKRYSSGMYARLGFSIAAHVDPDVLLVDEVLSVGDAVFRLRCQERMHEMVRGGTTLIFVSHNLDQVQSICPHTLVLEGGRSVFQGPSRKAVEHYLAAMSRAYADRGTDLSGHDGAGPSNAVELTSLRFLNDHGEEMVWVRPQEGVHVAITFRLSKPIPKLVVELNMRASVSENLLSVNSGRDDRVFTGSVGEHRMTLILPMIPLAGGQYFWNVRMWDADTSEAVLDTAFRFPMVLTEDGPKTGVLSLLHDWSFVGPTQERPEEQQVGSGTEPRALTRADVTGT